MANSRDIQRRIKSIGNTSQITKAMQLVSSSKMRRAQEQALAGRHYISALATVFAQLNESIDPDISPFLREGEGDRELMLVISTDKGLCGSLNTNLYKKLKSAHSSKTDYITIGKKLGVLLRKLMPAESMLGHYVIVDPVRLIALKPVFMQIRELFLTGKYARVYVVYTEYINTLVQMPQVAQLLPIRTEQLDKITHLSQENARLGETTGDFVLEPSGKGILREILPLFVFYDILQMLLEARASEHSARMVSMKAATENAQEIIKSLTLVYNKARQTAITSELTEISSAMKAME